MKESEKRAIERLIGTDSVLLDEMDLYISHLYTEAYWDEKNGLLVILNGKNVTDDIDQELKTRLIEHLKCEAKLLRNYEELFSVEVNNG